MEPETRMARMLHNSSTDDRLFQWRYRWEWRTPQRLLPTLQRMIRQGWHNFLVAGSVQDQLIQEFRNRNKREIRERGLTIWQRLEQEEKEKAATWKRNHQLDDDDDATNMKPRFVDRSQWKANAMEQMAAKHQSDYERGVYEVSFYN
jgi:hypothetical protein